MNTYASALDSRNLISTVCSRSAVSPHELVQAALAEQALPVIVDVDPVRGAGGLSVEEHAERGLALSLRETARDARRARGTDRDGRSLAGLLEHDVLAPRALANARADTTVAIAAGVARCGLTASPGRPLGTPSG